MVKSEKIYSPQTYLEKMTGLCCIIPVDKPIVDFIEMILDETFGERGILESHTFRY